VINIAYLSHYDATDVRSWSGTGRAMARCLSEAGFRVELTLLWQFSRFRRCCLRFDFLI
jgi:hypothetical protein